MKKSLQRPSFKINYLQSITSEKWINLALSNPFEILIDHAHCERKAAGVAIQLMFRYHSDSNLAEILSPVAREELEHFEKILFFLKSKGYELKSLKPPPYGAELSKNIRKLEPLRMLDSFCVAGLIEARSHERLAILALNSQDKEFSKLYGSLVESEARHFGIYRKLAQNRFSKEQVCKRWQELAKLESEIILETNLMPRIHS